MTDADPKDYLQDLTQAVAQPQPSEPDSAAQPQPSPSVSVAQSVPAQQEPQSAPAQQEPQSVSVTQSERHLEGHLRPPHVLVVGGGVAGLQMSRMLASAGVRVTLAEASDRLGGKVRRHDVGGIALDAGAESFATRRGTIAALAAELGLGGLLVTPSGAGAWLQPRTGPALPLPAAGLLGIPSIPLARDVIRIVGLAGALRAQLDSLMSGFVGSRERSLGALVRKRMGTAVLDRLVTPVASAIHSRHPDELDVDVVAPRVRKAVLSEGSLAKAVLTVRSAAPAGSAVQGLSGGLFQIAEALERDIAGRVEVRLGTRVVAIVAPDVGQHPAAPDVEQATAEPDQGQATVALDAGQHLVTFGDGSQHPFDAVVLATAIELGSAGQQVVAKHSSDAQTTITLATLVLDAPALDAAPRGSGVIVAAGAPGIRAKALTHATAKWAWLRDLAPGKHVVRLSYETAPHSDAELREQARSDAAALLGVALAPSQVLAFDRTTWPGASSGDSPLRHGMGPTAAPDVSTPFGIVHIGERVSGTGLQAIVTHTTEQAEMLIHDLAAQPGLRLT